MIVKFIDPGEKLPASMLKLGYSPRVQLHLKDGEICAVYGLSVWSNVLHYLVYPSGESLPSWLPADLFETIDPKLPLDWYLRYTREDGNPEWRIIIGYKELALDPSYYRDLIEMDRGAIRIFLDRKKEIDDES